ncbi:30S ribosomal protein S15 [Balamuthia mandrillaris]
MLRVAAASSGRRGALNRAPKAVLSLSESAPRRLLSADARSASFFEARSALAAASSTSLSGLRGRSRSAFAFGSRATFASDGPSKEDEEVHLKHLTSLFQDLKTVPNTKEELEKAFSKFFPSSPFKDSSSSASASSAASAPSFAPSASASAFPFSSAFVKKKSKGAELTRTQEAELAANIPSPYEGRTTLGDLKYFNLYPATVKQWIKSIKTPRGFYNERGQWERQPFWTDHYWKAIRITTDIREILQTEEERKRNEATTQRLQQLQQSERYENVSRILNRPIMIPELQEVLEEQAQLPSIEKLATWFNISAASSGVDFAGTFLSAQQKADEASRWVNEWDELLKKLEAAGLSWDELWSSQVKNPEDWAAAKQFLQRFDVVNRAIGQELQSAEDAAQLLQNDNHPIIDEAKQKVELKERAQQLKQQVDELVNLAKEVNWDAMKEMSVDRAIELAKSKRQLTEEQLRVLEELKEMEYRTFTSKDSLDSQLMEFLQKEQACLNLVKQDFANSLAQAREAIKQMCEEEDPDARATRLKLKVEQTREQFQVKWEKEEQRRKQAEQQRQQILESWIQKLQAELKAGSITPERRTAKEAFIERLQSQLHEPLYEPKTDEEKESEFAELEKSILEEPVGLPPNLTEALESLLEIGEQWVKEQQELLPPQLEAEEIPAEIAAQRREEALVKLVRERIQPKGEGEDEAEAEAEVEVEETEEEGEEHHEFSSEEEKQHFNEMLEQFKEEEAMGTGVDMDYIDKALEADHYINTLYDQVMSVPPNQRWQFLDQLPLLTQSQKETVFHNLKRMQAVKDQAFLDGAKPSIAPDLVNAYRFGVTEEELEEIGASPKVRELLSFRYATDREKTAYRVKRAVQTFRRTENDTGSSEVQVAVLTEKINYMGEALKKNHKDQNLKRALQGLVDRRRALLKHLKKNNVPAYYRVLKHYNLRDTIMLRHRAY